ncbi:DUF202 domain-containing protein [Nocardia harenae]|uniref:DUF202 domain-containing protein n=1 Tax=Nocardia harenae TaxID=358707 RepID=UPI000836F1E7|nr:DUF202 domain-containing protein [Nocardia harenae]
MNDPAGEGDTGLAIERTVLAWRRTAIAATAVALLLAIAALHRGWAPGAVVPCAAAVVMGVLAIAGFRRGRGLRHGRFDGADRMIALAAGVVAVAGCLAVVIALIAPVR